MSKDKISQYSSTSAGANLNTDIAGINIDEGCPPSGINNAIRALMSQVKDLQSGVSGDTIPIAAGGTGAASAASARAALGVALNADVLGYVAPGAAGNFLKSTGTDWTSAALATAVAVTSVTAGAGISLSASTGDVTITNTGVTNITAGAGISLSANTGSITISAAGGGGTLKSEIFDSSGTWTNPGNVSEVTVTVIGGGGGSGTLGGPGSQTSGNTSSFGSLVTATGGARSTTGPNSANPGTPGNGAANAGTMIVDHYVVALAGPTGTSSRYGYVNGLRSNSSGPTPTAAKVFSNTAQWGAGLAGYPSTTPPSPLAAGGEGGVAIVTNVPTPGPVPVTVGTGGTGNLLPGIGGAVVVEWIE